MKVDTDESPMALVDGDFLRSVFDGISDSIKIIDRAFNIIYTNQAGLAMTGRSSLQNFADAKRKCFEEFYQSEERCSFCIAHQVFESGLPAFNTFREGIGSNARVKEVSSYPLTDATGEVEYLIEIARDITELKKNLVSHEEFNNIISKDASMAEVFDLMDSVAPTNATVLIYGETGSGKELVARAIHKASKRVAKKFVAINCGAMTETLIETELFGHEKGSFTGAESRRIGVFEQANKGTLFLDEIGTISSAMQVKILRALQEGEITRVGGAETVTIDVRYVCATNADLKEEVDRGVFREDLYYRINVMPIHLPPLRERGSDIELLADHYLEEFNRSVGKNIGGFSTEALQSIRAYAWPGNVRELRNLVERAVILCKGGVIEKMDVPKEGRSGTEEGVDMGGTMKDVIAAVEEQYLKKTLMACGGNINKTAEKAGVNTRTIHRKLSQYNISKELYKDS